MVIESKSDSKVQTEVDPTYFALRSSLRPLDYRQHPSMGNRVGGHYRVALATGLVTGVAAAGPLLSVRWTNIERQLVLLRAIVQATIATAFTTAQETSVDLVKVGSFAASDTGGTAVDLSSDNRLAPDMQIAGLADLRIAGAAALGLGAGSVAEANAMAASILALGNGLGASAKDTLFDAIAGQEHPLIMSANSGFRIRNLFAQGAVGVVRFNIALVLAVLPAEY